MPKLCHCLNRCRMLFRLKKAFPKRRLQNLISSPTAILILLRCSYLGTNQDLLQLLRIRFFFCFFFRLSIMIRILSNYLRQQISPLLTTCQLQLWNLLRLSPDEFCQLCLLSERNFKFSFKGAFVILASRSPTRQSAKKYTGESCEKEIPLLLFNVLEGKLTIECLVQ